MKLIGRGATYICDGVMFLNLCGKVCHLSSSYVKLISIIPSGLYRNCRICTTYGAPTSLDGFIVLISHTLKFFKNVLSMYFTPYFPGLPILADPIVRMQSTVRFTFSCFKTFSYRFY